ncbi:LacI family DNA-binding transcriptional regulator [Nonomuraea sp. NPDC049129]|uniref:LacI family DNA-binding transcriptional regulator n=1 Tax=Nonomuraea sp. NPDC049129 TaxID=3155272 RepID=UPI0033E2F767
MRDTGRGPRRPAGSMDVARLAGVSQKTVSRVINGEPNVREHLRERVLQAARELGYRPNTAARALIKGRFHRIGVVSLGSTLYGPAATLVALERAARRTGYSLSIVCTLEGEPGGISAAIDSLISQGVDGIVLSEPIDEGQDLALDPDVPVLSFNQLSPPYADNGVFISGGGVAAGRAATEHLLSLGHATVWHVAGPQRWWAARDRLAGWREALAAAGVPEPPVLEGDWYPASGYAAGVELVAAGDVTAVFVANDDMAIGVMRAFSEAGLRVPEDVSLVGFDDSPHAAYLVPPLTTIHSDFEGAAVRGLQLLVERIEGATGPAVLEEPPAELIPRGSTAPPESR